MRGFTVTRCARRHFLSPSSEGRLWHLRVLAGTTPLVRQGWLEPGSPFPWHFPPDKIGTIIREGSWEGQRCQRLQSAGMHPSDEVLEVMRRDKIVTGERHAINKRDSWLR